MVLDKNPAIKTVVNKLASIDEKFRFFKMELLAGEARYETEVKEGGCRFLMDYSKVSIHSVVCLLLVLNYLK